MTSSIRRRVRAARWAALCAVILPSFACSGGSGGSAPYEIVSPSSRQVVVTPGQTVRFEIRANGGRTVEYVIDDVRTEPGPIFILQPSSQHHVVEALILPSDLAAPPDIVLFTVDVEAPGNLAPVITSFTVEPVTGEAEDTEFTARVTATDADGTVDSVSVDFGDGTPPARGVTIPFTATHTYAAEGTYTVVARAVDDAGVPASSVRQLTVAPHNDPPSGVLHAERIPGGPPQGVGPLTVRLETEGFDPDGTIATWEIDKDLGQGFELIGPKETVTVAYPFREDHYMPVLRLTDDQGESSEIAVDQDVVVLRDVSASESSYSVTGNPRFSGTAIAPAIWADGSDGMGFTVRIVDSQGSPVSGARVRVSSSRAPWIAPDGANLGAAVGVLPQAIVTTDVTGTATGAIVTNLSTRLEAMPIIDFEPFFLTFEVDLNRNFWVPLDLDDIPLNANSTVSAGGSHVEIQPGMGCPGQPLEIVVDAIDQSIAPGGGGPAAGKYTEVRFTNEELLPGLRPAQGYANWRTDGSGRIRLVYTPVRADQSKLFLAWVDGQPLGDIGTVFLKPPNQCNGQ
jgi:PKD repeat protein